MIDASKKYVHYIGSRTQDLTMEEMTALRHSILHYGKEEHPFPDKELLHFFSVNYTLECLAACYYFGGFDNSGKDIVLSAFQKIDG